MDLLELLLAQFCGLVSEILLPTDVVLIRTSFSLGVGIGLVTFTTGLPVSCTTSDCCVDAIVAV